MIGTDELGRIIEGLGKLAKDGKVSQDGNTLRIELDLVVKQDRKDAKIKELLNELYDGYSVMASRLRSIERDIHPEKSVFKTGIIVPFRTKK